MSALTIQPYTERKDRESNPVLSCLLQQEYGFPEKVILHLNRHLPPLWMTVLEDGGVNVLLLSRDQERSVQRRAFFSFNGIEQIFVHRQQISEHVLDSILLPRESNSADSSTDQRVKLFVQRAVTVVKRLQGWEVCVGVHELEYKKLWSIDKSGRIDKNPYGELRYQETFRPLACHLLVSTTNHIKRRCSVCIKAKIKFRVKLNRHSAEEADPRTRNEYLDINQLLSKVKTQQRELKNCRAQLVKLKAEVQRSLLQNGSVKDYCPSEEILKICMKYTAVCTGTNLEIAENVGELRVKKERKRKVHKEIATSNTCTNK